MKGLTPPQSSVLEWIKKFIAEKGYAPTRSEIAEGMGYSSQNAAEDHLKALQRKRHIRMTPRVARSIVVINADAATPSWPGSIR